MNRQIPDSSRLITAALFLLVISSTAQAQISRISRTEVDTRSRLPAGELGSAEELRGPGLFNSQRQPALSQNDQLQLRNDLREFQQEIDRLATAVEADYRRNTQLRSLLVELLDLREQMNRLGAMAAAQSDTAALVQSFQNIDAGWQVFSNRMTQARQLSAASQQALSRANLVDRRIERLLQVDPVLDRPALLQQLSGQQTALHFLTDELQRDVNSSPQLVTSSRKLEQQVSRVVSMVVENFPYEQIVSEYARFEQSWSELLPQLTQLKNTFVERNIQRLTQQGYQVHDLLWLENTVSRAVLQQLAESLIQHVDEFYRRTSLMLLVDFEDVGNTLNVAADFYGTVQNFRDNLERSEPEAQIIDSFRYVDEYALAFNQTFRRMRSQAAQVVLQEISTGVEAIRRELNLGNSSAVNPSGLRPVVATLEDLADQLDMDIRLWLNSEQPQWRNEVSAASLTFVRRAQQLHRLADVETRLQPLTQQVDSIYADWKTLYGFLSRCRTPERAALAWRARLINESLADLDRQLRP